MGDATDLPAGWRMASFGEVARNVNDNEKEPLKHGITRVVGLEHLDPCSLRITRWDEITDGTSFTRKFSRGQVLFGKRRAYQRKAALAEFDGICSSDILVFEAKSDVLVPELLPFVVQDDRFFEHAINTSSGSLSPRTKWKDLAAYTFPLPPIEEQRRIAEVLWAAEDVIVKDEALLAEAEHYKQVMMRELFSKGIGHEEFREVKKVGVVPKEWRICTLNRVAQSFKNGIYKKDKYYGTGYPSVRMYNIQNGMININGAPLLDVTKEELDDYGLKCGDILINRVNSIDLIGKAGIVPNGLGPITYESKNIRVRLDLNKVYPSFVGYFTQTDRYFSQIMMRVKSAIGQATINQNDLNHLLVPLPPLPEQRQIASILSAIDDTIAAARASVEASKALKMRLINQVLSPDGETT
ncbi:restriction endonuclease subunit S [uncultured Methanofollis sp.]|uniref:restriction endonuclease subunit S n=1 Tax=uncultured Methanofollis sp. TaxID=262500 RepID=UPI002631C489|nr:restriction endonuclease subunit S [uncultured Methanofollis sp.]